MSLYLVINWFFFITCALLIGFIFYSRRYYFVKPSILLITFSIIFFQFPLAIFSATYEVTVPDPYILSFLIHGYIYRAYRKPVHIQGFNKGRLESNHKGSRFRLPRK